MSGPDSAGSSANPIEINANAVTGRFDGFTNGTVNNVANTGGDALAKLEMRLAALMESGRSVPPELEEAIRSLSERIDRIQSSQDGRAQLSHSDQLVLGALEDRIVKHTFKSMARPVEPAAPMGRVLTPKPLEASEAECDVNPRARSAKLRAMEKVA